MSNADGHNGRSSKARKLPVGQIIRLTYATYFNYFVDVLRTTWLWLVLVTSTLATANWLKWSWSIRFTEQFNKGTIPEEMDAIPYVAVALYIFGGLLAIFAAVDIAVAWHRRLILAERPGRIGVHLASIGSWRYLGLATVLMAAAAIAPAAGIATSMLDIDSLPPTTGWLLVIGLVFLIAFATFGIATRFELVLPASAVGNFDLSFSRSWRLTRGNTWRLFWVVVACVIVSETPPELLLSQFGVSEADVSDDAKVTGEGLSEKMIGVALSMQLNIAYHLLILPIYVGLLSLCYQHFIGTSVGFDERRP